MTYEPMDPEQIAALFDGRLSTAERDQVLEHLARSPADYELFAEAAGLMDEAGLEPEVAGDTSAAPASHPGPAAVPSPAPAPPPSISRRGWRAAPVRLWLPLAAVLAAVVLVPLALRRMGGETGPVVLLDGRDLVDAPGDGSLAARLGADWNEPEWNRTRGGGDTRDDAEREFRLGVRVAQLEVTLDASDAPAAGLAAAQIEHLLEGVSAARPYAAEYTRLATPPLQATPGERRDAREQLSTLLGHSPWFELGVWTEQARLATRTGRQAFFDKQAVRALDRTASRLQGRTEASAALQSVQSVRRILDDGVSPAELPQLGTAVDGVMKASTGAVGA